MFVLVSVKWDLSTFFESLIEGEAGGSTKYLGAGLSRQNAVRNTKTVQQMYKNIVCKSRNLTLEESAQHINHPAKEKSKNMFSNFWGDIVRGTL